MTTVRFNNLFPGYEILGELALANARVLKARNQVTGEIVAIKHFSLSTNADTIARFQRESEIMTSIQHPNIVKIIEVQLEADLPYIVMEFIDGGDLRSLLKKNGRLDVSTTIRLGLQMADAFKAIHTKDIIHRDIKPENILYRKLQNDELHFLLTDFGIAKLREQQVTLTGQSMMTYEYASPEQFDNPKNISFATDYYSLGVVLYECLAGRVPFPLIDGRVHTLMNQVIGSTSPDIELADKTLLAPSLKKLINGMLAKNEADRIRDVPALKRLLKTADLEESDGFSEIPPTTIFPGNVNRDTQKTPPKLPITDQETPADKPGKLFRIGIVLLLVFVLVIGIIIFNTEKKQPYVFNPATDSTAIKASDSSKISSAVDSAVTVADSPKAIYNPAVDSVRKTPDQLKKDSDKQVVSNDPPVRYFFEDFISNKNGWVLENDSLSEMTITGGKLHMVGLSNNYIYSSQKLFDLDYEKDFTVSVTVTWIDGVSNGFGIILYCDNPESRITFTIKPEGEYCIKNQNDNKWNILVDWKTSVFLNRNHAANILTVMKKGQNLDFLINDQKVETVGYTKFVWKYLGCKIGGQQTVDFDDFDVSGIFI